VFETASFKKRIVDVPDTAEVLVFEITSDLEDPPLNTRPSMLTLSAPSKSIIGAARFPLIERPDMVGNILSVVKLELPVPLAFKTAVEVSVVLAIIRRVTLPVSVPVLMASKAALRVA
jgi:hypothetical protein